MYSCMFRPLCPTPSRFTPKRRLFSGWSKVNEILPKQHLDLFLPGYLGYNKVAKKALRDYTDKRGFYPKLFGELLDAPCDDATSLLLWAPKEWVCEGCIVILLRAALFPWLVSRLTQGATPW